MGRPYRVQQEGGGLSILAFKVKTVADTSKAELVEWRPAEGQEIEGEGDWRDAREAWLGMNPLTSRIIAIGTRARMADGRVVDRTFTCTRSLHDQGEARMLQDFVKYVCEGFAHFTTWNGKNWDLPTLRTRCRLLGVEPLTCLSEKPWETYPGSSNHADMLREIFGTGPKRLGTLRNACLALGAPADAVPHDKHVHELLAAGDARGIADQAQRSAHAIAFLYDRFYAGLNHGPMFAALQAAL